MLHGLLLAGGKSSRMGSDKSALEFRGRTLLDHAIAMLRETGVDNLLISGDVAGYDCVPDLIPECGPPGGVYSAMAHLAAEKALDGSLLLVIPVDMPLLDAQVLSVLAESAGQADSARFSGEVFPCAFRVTERFLEYLQEIFSQASAPGGVRSMKSLLRAFDCKEIPLDDVDARVFRNVNTPEEWERIRQS